MEYGKQTNLNVTSLKKEERTIACNAIITKIEGGKKYYLIGLRAKHKSGGGQWGLVGGTQAIGETMEQTLQRELFEEIGINVELKDIKWDNFFQCIATEKVHFDHHGFVVEKWTGEVENKEPDKCDELKWVKEEDLPLDNFFVSKGNLVNYLNGEKYNTNTNFSYNKTKTTTINQDYCK